MKIPQNTFRDALKAGQRSLRSAIQAVADALSAHGFAAHAEGRNDQLKIINNHCPFGDVAAEHPVICAVDRGMVRGMLSELYDAEKFGIALSYQMLTDVEGVTERQANELHMAIAAAASSSTSISLL